MRRLNGGIAFNFIPQVFVIGCSEMQVVDTNFSSNSFFFASRFLEEAKLYKLEIHSVLHQGAFIKKIENEET